MKQPRLSQNVVNALKIKSAAFPRPPKIKHVVARWEAYGAPGFQCLPGFRPGMAGEVRDFVAKWKHWELTQK